MMFETISEYYRKSLFTQSDIHNFVLIGWITEAEQSQILNK